MPAAAPVIFKPGTFLEKDYRAEERAWADKHLLAPAIARWQGQPWAADAEKFCRAGLDAEILGFWKDLRIGALAPDANKLLQAGCRDALVANLAWRALYRSRGNWRDGEIALDVMCTQLPDVSRCNGALAMFIGDIVKAEAHGKQADSGATPGGWRRALTELRRIF